MSCMRYFSSQESENCSTITRRVSARITGRRRRPLAVVGSRFAPISPELDTLLRRRRTGHGRTAASLTAAPDTCRPRASPARRRPPRLGPPRHSPSTAPPPAPGTTLPEVRSRQVSITLLRRVCTRLDAAPHQAKSNCWGVVGLKVYARILFRSTGGQQVMTTYRSRNVLMFSASVYRLSSADAERHGAVCC